MADHCERWMWRDPGEIIDRLLARSEAAERRAVAVPHETPVPVQTRAPRDRHYTQARRLHIRNLMKGLP